MRNANKMTLLGAMLMTAVSAQAFNVKGTIVDKTTKEPLIGATIQIEGTTTGAITDIDGRFELSNLKGNNCTLVIQYVSYQSQRITINAGQKKNWSSHLLQILRPWRKLQLQPGRIWKMNGLCNWNVSVRLLPLRIWEPRK